MPLHYSSHVYHTIFSYTYMYSKIDGASIRLYANNCVYKLCKKKTHTKIYSTCKLVYGFLCTKILQSTNTHGDKNHMKKVPRLSAEKLRKKKNKWEEKEVEFSRFASGILMPSLFLSRGKSWDAGNHFLRIYIVCSLGPARDTCVKYLLTRIGRKEEATKTGGKDETGLRNAKTIFRTFTSRNVSNLLALYSPHLYLLLSFSLPLPRTLSWVQKNFWKWKFVDFMNRHKFWILRD